MISGGANPSKDAKQLDLFGTLFFLQDEVLNLMWCST